jgi:hypothetical protein
MCPGTALINASAVMQLKALAHMRGCWKSRNKKGLDQKFTNMRFEIRVNHKKNWKSWGNFDGFLHFEWNQKISKASLSLRC